MVCAILFGNFQKIWAVICSDTIFLLFLVCSADFDMLLSGLFSHSVKFYSSMFMLYAQDFHPGGLCMVSSPGLT